MSARIAEGLAATILLVWLSSVHVETELSSLRLGWITVLMLAAISLWITLTVLFRRSLVPIASRAATTGAGALLVNASILARSGLRLVEGGLKMSIHRSNWEQAFSPLGYAHRSAAKLVVDGMSARIGEGLAAIILLLWLSSVHLETELSALRLGWMTVLLLAAISVWITLTVLFRRSLVPIAGRAATTGAPRLEIPLPDS